MAQCVINQIGQRGGDRRRAAAHDDRPFGRFERQMLVGPERLRRLFGDDVARHRDEIDIDIDSQAAAGQLRDCQELVNQPCHGTQIGTDLGEAALGHRPLQAGGDYRQWVSEFVRDFAREPALRLKAGIDAVETAIDRDHERREFCRRLLLSEPHLAAPGSIIAPCWAKRRTGSRLWRTVR